MWVPWMQRVIHDIVATKPEGLWSRSKQFGVSEDDFGGGGSFENTLLQNSVGKKKME